MSLKPYRQIATRGFRICEILVIDSSFFCNVTLNSYLFQSSISTSVCQKRHRVTFSDQGTSRTSTPSRYKTSEVCSSLCARILLSSDTTLQIPGSISRLPNRNKSIQIPEAPVSSTPMYGDKFDLPTSRIDGTQLLIYRNDDNDR